MGKDATLSRLKENQASATAKFIRVPPRKARLVIDAVRGKYVSDALAILKFVPNFAAEAIGDVIQSAVANAENSRPHDEDGRPMAPLLGENLKLVRAFVDEGPRIKRVQPRAQGRAYRIVKRMCHITVIVEEVEPKPRPLRPQRTRRPQAAAKPATPAKTAAAPAKAKAPAEATAPAEVTTPVDVTAPAEVTTVAENTAPIEGTGPAEEAASVAPAEGVTDEAGAPVTAEAEPAAESEKNEHKAPSEAPKAE